MSTSLRHLFYWSLGGCSLSWSAKQILAHLSVALSYHAHNFNFPDLLQQRHTDVSLGERKSEWDVAPYDQRPDLNALEQNRQSRPSQSDWQAHQQASNQGRQSYAYTDFRRMLGEQFVSIRVGMGKTKGILRSTRRFCATKLITLRRCLAASFRRA
jgi:hypothetical protein